MFSSVSFFDIQEDETWYTYTYGRGKHTLENSLMRKHPFIEVVTQFSMHFSL